jgi:hypothetical protein
VLISVETLSRAIALLCLCSQDAAALVDDR